MPKPPNFKQEKRRREDAQKKRNQEKEQKKAERKESEPGSQADGTSQSKLPQVSKVASSRPEPH